MIKIPKKSKKSASQLDSILGHEIGKIRKTFSIRTTSEIGVVHGLYLAQATDVYKRLEHYRKTGERMKFSTNVTPEKETIKVEKIKPKKVKTEKKAKVTNSIVMENNPLQDHLIRIRKLIELEKSTVTRNQIEEGFVYVVTNPAYHGWYKIGMTVDYEDRLNTYNTGDPNRAYKLEAARWTGDRKNAESLILTELKKIASQYKNEWVKLDEHLLFTTFYSLAI